MINYQTRSHFQMTYRYAIKILLVTVLALLVGMIIGLGNTYAESRTNVYVPGAGNVGFANTAGWGSIYAQGTSTSSVTLSYLGAHIRFWHTGPLLQSENSKNWYNSKGGSTDTIYTSGGGDRATTNSGFYQSGGANYYTSYPHNSASCYTHWATGNSC